MVDDLISVTRNTATKYTAAARGGGRAPENFAS